MSWQKELQSGFKHPQDLLRYLELDETLGSNDAHKAFKTRVPRSFARRMLTGDKNCPLLKQVLATDDELSSPTSYSVDPLKETIQNPMPGILHKYHGRVLVMPAVSCAINCRYCFRRHFPYEDNQLATKDWPRIFGYLEANKEIHEVILSGGDPLMLSNALLAKFLNELAEISHIKTLRFHTRLPVVIPSRVDKTLLNILTQTRFNRVMVLHINHANELCDELATSISLLKNINVTMLNQSVLLKGINDSEEELVALSHGLFNIGVLPYYLHALDKVNGAAHFEVTESRSRSLYKAMQLALPGYLLPKFVRELPGLKHKALI